MIPNRWKRDFNAIGIIPSSGKYSKGTFAHPDIAFEFASWLSPEFKLYLIKEFERLKTNEAYQYKLEWSATRLLSKVNYVVHTELGIENCRFYDLRGTFATRALRNGVEIRDMADILGHSKIEATENYYISTTEETLKEVSEKFEQTVNQML